jgi:hypothetical protein
MPVYVWLLCYDYISWLVFFIYGLYIYCLISPVRACSRFSTLLYSLLSLFSARSCLAALYMLSHIVTHSHALLHVIMNGHSCPFVSRLSLLLMFCHTWSLIVTVGHALSRFATVLYCLLS